VLANESGIAKSARKRMRGEHYDRNRALLVEMVWRRQMPVLTGTKTPYHVPPSTPAPLVYRGLPLDQVEDLVLTSSRWKQVSSFLLPSTTAGWDRMKSRSGHRSAGGLHDQDGTSSALSVCCLFQRRMAQSSGRSAPLFLPQTQFPGNFVRLRLKLCERPAYETGHT
jgi:hypothetical protein